MSNVTYKLKIKKGFYNELKSFVDNNTMEYLLDLDTYTGSVTNAKITPNNQSKTDVTINFDFDYEDYSLDCPCDYDELINLCDNPEILNVYSVVVDWDSFL